MCLSPFWFNQACSEAKFKTWRRRSWRALYWEDKEGALHFPYPSYKAFSFSAPQWNTWGVIWAHSIWLSSGFGETESSSVTQAGLQLTDTFLLYLPSAGPEAESEVRSASPGFDRIGCLLTWATVISDFCFYTCAVDAMGELQGFRPTPH